VNRKYEASQNGFDCINKICHFLNFKFSLEWSDRSTWQLDQNCYISPSLWLFFFCFCAISFFFSRFLLVRKFSLNRLLPRHWRFEYFCFLQTWEK
jgi:hypothetical protein